MSQDRFNKNSKPYNRNSKGGETEATVKRQPGPGAAIQARPLEVKVFDGNIEKAIKTFRAIVQKDRILSLYKEKGSYEKPSVRRRRKKSEYIRNLKDAERKGYRK